MFVYKKINFYIEHFLNIHVRPAVSSSSDLIFDPE